MLAWQSSVQYCVIGISVFCLSTYSTLLLFGVKKKIWKKFRNVLSTNTNPHKHIWNQIDIKDNCIVASVLIFFLSIFDAIRTMIGMCLVCMCLSIPILRYLNIRKTNSKKKNICLNAITVNLNWNIEASITSCYLFCLAFLCSLVLLVPFDFVIDYCDKKK